MHVPLALKLLTAFFEKSYPGMLGYFFCRFRFYDDVLITCIEKNELHSVVNLGAGMVPKAYYVPGIENVRYYETDHPAVIKRKKEKIERIMGKLPEHVTYVSVNFNAQDIEGQIHKNRLQEHCSSGKVFRLTLPKKPMMLSLVLCQERLQEATSHSRLLRKV